MIFWAEKSQDPVQVTNYQIVRYLILSRLARTSQKCKKFPISYYSGGGLHAGTGKIMKENMKEYIHVFFHVLFRGLHVSFDVFF